MHAIFVDMIYGSKFFFIYISTYNIISNITLAYVIQHRAHL